MRCALARVRRRRRLHSATPRTPPLGRDGGGEPRRDGEGWMLDRNHPELSVRQQCALLSLARSGVYRPVPTEDVTDLALMRRIDEWFLAYPFLGPRRMAKMRSREGAREPQAGAAPDAADGH